MTSIASVTWNDLIRNINQNFLEYKIGEFKKIYSKYTLPSTIIETKLQQFYHQYTY